MKSPANEWVMNAGRKDSYDELVGIGRFELMHVKWKYDFNDISRDSMGMQ